MQWQLNSEIVDEQAVNLVLGMLWLDKGRLPHFLYHVVEYGDFMLTGTPS